MKVTVLIDNLPHQGPLVTEHGLSLLIQSNAGTVLFDTGASAAFMDNAKRMGIDLRAVERVVLSHAHYDHTGGLEAFLEWNTRAEVWVKEGFMAPKFKKDRYIGLPWADYPLERFRFLSGSSEVLPGLMAVTEIPLRFPEDAHFRDFFTGECESAVPDTFEEELFLLAPDSGLIISACSHRGLSNILHAANDVCGRLPTTALGGFHLKDDTVTQRRAAAMRWKEAGVKELYAGHCTGGDNLPHLQEIFGASVRFFGTGDVFQF